MVDQNKKIINRSYGKAIVMALGLGMTAPVYAYGIGNFFAPVPQAIRQAMSGIALSAGQLHQSYTEYPAAGSSTPNPADTQTGNIPHYALDFDGMGDYFGMGVHFNYDHGNTAYNGYLQQYGGGGQIIYTPYSGTTKATMFSYDLMLRGGFSPNPHIAVIPDVFYGVHYWDRNLQGPYGNDEKYLNIYDGLGISLVGQPVLNVPVVIRVDYQSGHIIHAAMLSSAATESAQLGSKPWTKYGVEVDYTPWRYTTIFLGYTHTKFQFGKSGTITFNNGKTGYEPDSTTKQNVTQIGVRFRF